MAPSPPGHGNFDFQPIVYRGPYEYGSPEVDTDYYPQTQPPPPGARPRRRHTSSNFVGPVFISTMTSASQVARSPWPHRWAVVLACATFPLVWVGGLVTTTDAGMAVPDWPNTYGYNLFLYPWTTWLSGPWDLFVEHGHRLLGATVGMLTIGLLISLWMGEESAMGAKLGICGAGAGDFPRSARWHASALG